MTSLTGGRSNVQSWSMDHLTRLARMGQVRSIPADTVILKQTEPPQCMYAEGAGSWAVSAVAISSCSLETEEEEEEEAVAALSLRTVAAGPAGTCCSAAP